MNTQSTKNQRTIEELQAQLEELKAKSIAEAKSPETHYTDNHWMIGKEVHRMRITSSDKFSNKKVGKQSFFINTGQNGSSDTRKAALTELTLSNYMDGIDGIDQLGDVNADHTFYTCDASDNKISVHYSAIATHIKDNDTIERYLEDTFGEYVSFIKEWLAVYTYTNYNKLPFLVLQGERGTGKSIFLEMVASIFPQLAGVWDGEGSDFTYHYDRKFVMVEESQSKGENQYKELKAMSGSKFLEINKKFQDPYMVKNNINVGIASNDAIPIFVEGRELPTDPKNNQFFVYEFKRLAKMDANIANVLQERLGHYIRTELRDIFSALYLNDKRYSVECPITEEEKALFANNVTNNSFEVELIIQDLITDIDKDDSDFQEYKGFIEKEYLPIKWIEDKVSSKNKADVLKSLKKEGYLVGNSTQQRSNGYRHSCYQMTDKFLNEIKEDLND